MGAGGGLGGGGETPSAALAKLSAEYSDFVELCATSRRSSLGAFSKLKRKSWYNTKGEQINFLRKLSY